MGGRTTADNKKGGAPPFYSPFIFPPQVQQDAIENDNLKQILFQKVQHDGGENGANTFIKSATGT